MITEKCRRWPRKDHIAPWSGEYHHSSCCHPLAEYGVPTGRGFWQPFDLEHLARCDELWVLMLEGWRCSAGVQAGIQLATEIRLPIRYVPFTSGG
jgi:hypothetical protein